MRVGIDGELDIIPAERCRTASLAQLAMRPAALIIDISGLRFPAAAGIEVFARLWRRGYDTAVPARLQSATGQPAMVLCCTAVWDLLCQGPPPPDAAVFRRSARRRAGAPARPLGDRSS